MSAELSPTRLPAEPAGGAFRLPLSGVAVQMEPPSGVEDLLLTEHRGTTLQLAYLLMRRLVRWSDDSVEDLAQLPLYELDLLLLRLRQSLFGDRIATDATCPAQGCCARMDVSFGIDEYLEHHRPRGVPWKSRSVVASVAERGWHRLTRRSDGREIAQFRPPTVRDVLDLPRGDAALAQLSGRCIRPATLGALERRAVEAALEAIAPCLSSDLEGRCPECGTVIRVAYTPRQYCITELRQRARFVVEEVDLLAERYHWCERDILAMPGRRRVAYAELARQARGSD